MLSESMAAFPKSGVFPGARYGVGSGMNVFRDAWQYRISEAGMERLAARKGASPAFLSILAIARAGAVSFAQIARQMPHIAGDDLELWLSAMCTMGLLSTDESATAVVTDLPADAHSTVADHPVTAPAPAGLALLVHADARTRAHWRRALTGRGFELLEAADLESVETCMRERRPAWVVLGLEGEDFDGVHLLRALKRPRAPRVSRVCLVVPRGHTLGGEESETAARADATAASVTDIVRALCGDAALETAVQPVSQPNTDKAVAPESAATESTTQDAHVPIAGAPLPAAPAQEPAPVKIAKEADSGKPGPRQAPANAPVWMNLLYGDAYRYGSFATDFPSDLESQYPRLLVRLIESWSRPDFEREINSLIIDDRGDRHGFPPEVMDELWFLNEIHQLRREAESQSAGALARPRSGAKSSAKSAAKPESLLQTSRMGQWMASNKSG